MEPRLLLGITQIVHAVADHQIRYFRCHQRSGCPPTPLCVWEVLRSHFTGLLEQYPLWSQAFHAAMNSQASFDSGRDAPASALPANSRPGVLGSLHPDRGSRICALDEPSETLLCATVRSRDHFGMTSVPLDSSHKSASNVGAIVWFNQSCMQRRGRGRPSRRGDPSGKAAGIRADLAGKCSAS